MGNISNLTLGWRTVMMGMVCLPILVCVVLLVFRKTEQQACRFLAAFLLACVLAVTPQIIGFAGFYNVWPGLTYFPLFSTELWLGALIYLHGYSLMNKGPLGWRKFLLVLGILQSIYYFWAFFGLGDYQSKWAYNGKIHGPYVLPVENILTILSFLAAVIAIWRMVVIYRNYLEQTSSAAREYDPVWLRNLIIAIACAGGIFSALELASVFMTVGYDRAFPFQVISMMILAWIAIESVWRLEAAYPKMGGSLTLSESKPQVKNWAEEVEALQTQVKQQAWFLEPRLSIRDVAARMGTNETYISRALNHGLGKSFNAFVNSLRVEHAKTLIRNGSGSILNIAYESGFNSKATFNRVFRDMTGETPTQYKTSQNR